MHTSFKYDVLLSITHWHDLPGMDNNSPIIKCMLLINCDLVFIITWCSLIYVCHKCLSKLFQFNRYNESYKSAIITYNTFSYYFFTWRVKVFTVVFVTERYKQVSLIHSFKCDSIMSHKAILTPAVSYHVIIKFNFSVIVATIDYEDSTYIFYTLRSDDRLLSPFCTVSRPWFTCGKTWTRHRWVWFILSRHERH